MKRALEPRRDDNGSTDSEPPPAGQEQPERRQPRPLGKRFWTVIVVAGVLGTAVLSFGMFAAIDLLSYDQTSGGTPPAYDDHSGEPIDWEAQERTDAGYRKPGFVIDAHLDCATGMVRFEVRGIGVGVDWGTVSDRAIQVHEPREACAAGGFEPGF